MAFGGWSITEMCFDYIRDILLEGKTILELGSGEGTKELAKHYKMYSIENYKEWIDKYDSTYIYAPIRKYQKESDKSWWNDEEINFTAPEGISSEDGSVTQKGWFDPDIVKSELPKEYDLILVDGPNGMFGRGGFYKYLHWFKSDVPIIIDDIDRKAEEELMILVSKKLNRKYKVLTDGVTGVIL